MGGDGNESLQCPAYVRVSMLKFHKEMHRNNEFFEVSAIYDNFSDDVTVVLLLRCLPTIHLFLI